MDCSGNATGCSYSTFPPGTVTLGQSTNTPVGTNEQVTLLDANGNPFGVQLTFDNVTTAGQTNGAYTNQGPVPPNTSFTLLPVWLVKRVAIACNENWRSAAAAILGISAAGAGRQSHANAARSTMMSARIVVYRRI